MTKLEIIKQYIDAFDKLGKLARFNTIAREHLSSLFSIAGITAHYSVPYKIFITTCTDRDMWYCLSNSFSEQDLTKFINVLLVERSVNEELDKQMSLKDKPEIEQEKKDGIAAIAALQNKREMPEVKDGAVRVEPNSLSAGIKFEVDVAGILSSAARQYLDSDAAGILTHVSKRITEEAQKLRPTQITIGTKEPVVIKGKLHVCFQELLEIVKYEKQAFLVGPAGTGKTTLASQVADAFKLAFAHISCTAGMSEAHLTGRMLADGTYIPSEFVTLYENGGVFLFDEVDAADPNTLLIINSALANGYMSLPNRKGNPKAKRHADFFAICAANTWGNGSNQYAGRSILDAAFLDRFCMGKVEVNYDKDLEKEILRDNATMANKLWKVRSNVENSKIRRVVSTRAFVSASINSSVGKTEKQILDRFFTGWSKEEIAKAMQGV